jgi:hypothetical protein
MHAKERNNGVVVDSDSTVRRMPGGPQINHWVREGENTTALAVLELVGDTMAEEPSQHFARLNIIEVTVTEKAQAIDTVASLEYVWDGKRTFPIGAEESFAVNNGQARCYWVDAEQVTGETIDMKSLEAFVGRIHGALSRKDYTALEPLLQTKTVEMGKAFYFDIDDRRKAQKRFFTKELFKTEGFEMEPLDMASLRIMPHAQGRLLELTTESGEALISSKPLEDGSTYSLPLFVCMKDGSWHVCR